LINKGESKGQSNDEDFNTYKSFYSLLMKDCKNIHRSFDSPIKIFKESIPENNKNKEKERILKFIIKYEKIKCFLKCNETKDQDSLINMVLECVPENKDEFKNSLNISLNHYNIEDIEEEDKKDSSWISKEILESFNHGKISSNLLHSKIYIYI